MTSNLRSDEIAAQLADLSLQVIDEQRLQLMGTLRFMDVALWRMPVAAKPIGKALASDGYLMYVEPVSLLRAYRKAPADVARDCLHAILHCVFGHPFDAGRPVQWLWDLSCDIAVESCALELAGLRFASEGDLERRRALETLKGACPQLTAAKVYDALEQVVQRQSASSDPASTAPASAPPALTMRFVESLPELFARDDHAVWRRERERPASQVTFDDDVSLIGSSDERLAGDRPEEVESDESKSKPGVDMPGVAAPSAGGAAVEGEVEGGDRFVDAAAYEEAEAEFASMGSVQLRGFDDVSWTDIGALIDVEMGAYVGKAGIDAGTFELNLQVGNRKAYDYREFLKRFSALSEEMKVSTEEFDYIYYTYGLSRYGNMPLVEPLEYQESRRIREFVIAIDTSASCAGGLVKHFVEKTYDVLRSQAAFGRKVNVHIVQCDCEVRKDTKVTSVRDLDDGFGEFTARGFGGTDFRPVFAYVDDLVATRELPNLKGMIYLTDGIGKYPEEAPGYDCAFVFINEEGAQRSVPPWAMKVMMTEDEIMEL